MSAPKEEPILIAPPPPKTLCPVCGQATYSPGGIHPQCAMQQADEPRLARLKTKRVVEAKKSARNVWKKECPKCGIAVHVRLAVCKCGHKFSRQ